MQRINKEKQGYTLHIRPSDKVREALSKAAKLEGRTLAKEIERRLAASVAAPKPAALDPEIYGWAAPDKAKALADTIGTIVGGVLDYAAPAGDRPVTLGMVKAAIGYLLDGLGASDPTDDQKATVWVYAQHDLKMIQRVEGDPTKYTEKPEFAVYAALVGAWGTFDKPKE